MKEQLRLVRTLLEKRKARHKEHRFVVEGPHLVEEAAELIDFVVYAERLPILPKLEDLGIDCLKVSKKQFTEISEVETPQWILAVVKEQQFSLRDILKTENPLIVFCVEVQDPGNLGTIIRIADAVGAAGIILSRGTVDLYNGKVIRSTMGSLFHLPIVSAEDSIEMIEVLKKKQVRIVAADINGQKDYFEADYRDPTAVLVGNEGAGLPEGIVGLADDAVKIPMPGKAESLNVGVSTAVVLYEALRQRTYAGKD
ncbi:MAG: RNA methyltransferase [Candidatus Margulisiibacteriota bacterium]